MNFNQTTRFLNPVSPSRAFHLFRLLQRLFTDLYRSTLPKQTIYYKLPLHQYINTSEFSISLRPLLLIIKAKWPSPNIHHIANRRIRNNPKHIQIITQSSIDPPLIRKLWVWRSLRGVAGDVRQAVLEVLLLPLPPDAVEEGVVEVEEWI